VGNELREVVLSLFSENLASKINDYLKGTFWVLFAIPIVILLMSTVMFIALAQAWFFDWGWIVLVLIYFIIIPLSIKIHELLNKNPKWKPIAKCATFLLGCVFAFYFYYFFISNVINNSN